MALDPSLDPSSFPHPYTPRPNLSATVLHAFNFALGSSRISALLPCADTHWTQNNPNISFGKTYNTPTPGLWACQLLGLNFLTASHLPPTCLHVKCGLSKLSQSALSSVTPPSHIPGQNFYYSRLLPTKSSAHINPC